MEKVAYCKRCGRRLKNPTAKERGYGDTCFKKVQAARTTEPLWLVKKSK